MLTSVGRFFADYRAIFGRLSQNDQSIDFVDYFLNGTNIFIGTNSIFLIGTSLTCIYLFIYLFISFIRHNIIEIFTNFKSKGDSANGTTRPMLGATLKPILNW